MSEEDRDVAVIPEPRKADVVIAYGIDTVAFFTALGIQQHLQHSNIKAAMIKDPSLGREVAVSFVKDIHPLMRDTIIQEFHNTDQINIWWN